MRAHTGECGTWEPGWNPATRVALVSPGRLHRRDQRAAPIDLRSRSVLAGEASAAAAKVDSWLATPPDRTAAAFFDDDNTVMQGASIYHLAKGLHRRNFFTTRQILGAAWKQAYFRVVGVEDPDHVAEARASALEFF